MSGSSSADDVTPPRPASDRERPTIGSPGDAICGYDRLVDREWVDLLLKELGARYRAGPSSGTGAELHYRSGRAEFRPSRFVVGCGESGQELELTVDVRIPRGADPHEQERLVAAFERQSAAPRGFSRIDDQESAVKAESGHASGSVRTLRYRHGGVEPAEAAKQIRAIVESIDIPITVGIHEPEQLTARDPLPPRAKPRRALEPMEKWEYELDGRLLRSLTVIVDPNDRTLRVFERRLFSRKAIGDTLKLAHVAKFALRRRSGGVDLVAIRRDGSQVVLARGSEDPEFVATAGRLAKKVFIPIEEG